MDEQHITSVFDRDLEAIRAMIMRMGGLVEAALLDGARALKRGDGQLAERVRAGDREIDALEARIHEACARLLALRQPIASDLRTVLSVMKIAANLERMGDYAKNMAKRSAVLNRMPPVEGAPGSIQRMASQVHAMLSDMLDAFIRRDLERAREIRERDLEIDQMYNALFREFLTFMVADPRSISACMHLHFIAKNIERAGDHVTAIAEQTIYAITGELPGESRSKANQAAYELPGSGGA